MIDIICEEHRFKILFIPKDWTKKFPIELNDFLSKFIIIRQILPEYRYGTQYIIGHEKFEPTEEFDVLPELIPVFHQGDYISAITL